MNSNLLQVTRSQTPAMARKKTLPLWVEVRVNPETSPYLVTSSSGFVWVEDAFEKEGGMVRAAVRVAAPGSTFMGVVESVAARGREHQWGNVQPFTLEGVMEAIAHVEGYSMGEVEVLMAPGDGRPAWATTAQFGCNLHGAAWLPDGYAVVVPVDREFIGILTHLSPKHLAVVVHNASRALGISVG